MKRILCLAATLGATAFQILAQTNNGLASGDSVFSKAEIGQPAPDFLFTHLINGQTKTARISDFKGKLLILDFWDTECGACVASWPKLIDLQNRFPDQIQILLVNPWENETTINEAFRKRKNLKGIEMSLPTSCIGDSNIAKIFPVSALPEVIWIDGAGIVKGMTLGGLLNEKNIRRILNGDQVKLHTTNGNNFIIPDFNKPLFINGNGGTVETVFLQSILTKYPDSLWYASSILSDSEKRSFRIMCTGCAIEELYNLAYSRKINEQFGNVDLMLNNRIRLEMPDSSKYVSFMDGEPLYDNYFVYSLTSPPADLKKLQRRMRADLDFYFGLDVKWEKRRIKCLVLTADDTTLIQCNQGKSSFYERMYSHIRLNGVTVEHFISGLEDEYFQSPYPFIDETNYKGKLGCIEFETNTGDYKALDKALALWKMHLRLLERNIDILVIKEKNQPKATSPSRLIPTKAKH